MIEINYTRCSRCGRCAFDCFPGAITMEEQRPVLQNPGNCIGCNHCIAICPTGAISDPTLPLDDLIIPEASASPELLLSQMRSRRSIRHFQSRPVSDSDLQMLLEAARACPTAKNLQATRYIAVTERIPQLLDAALHRLGTIGQMQKETATAPDELRRADNFIRWADTRKQDASFDPLFFHAPLLLLFVAPRESVRDAASAAAYAELMAASLSLGCLYSGYFTACAAGNPEISEILGLSENEEVVRCLVLGHPDVKFQRSAPRKPVNLTKL